MDHFHIANPYMCLIECDALGYIISSDHLLLRQVSGQELNVVTDMCVLTDSAQTNILQRMIMAHVGQRAPAAG